MFGRRRFMRYGQGYGQGYGYGPGRGRGRGYADYGGRGYGRRFVSPNCDWFPDRPRGWWVMPEYQSQISEEGTYSPPVDARWDPTGKPLNEETVEYEISWIEKQIESLQKDIKLLQSMKSEEKQ
ncbi:unnamed protein product [marine sediment metagenome]|uniref:DUF5320 domain-containing protein n=1 Tax=marine sediment metagenome TaxID=412755 RepID=X1BY07_9ZZZZ